jgi:hypothetical protein
VDTGHWHLEVFQYGATDKLRSKVGTNAELVI